MASSSNMLVFKLALFSFCLHFVLTQRLPHNGCSSIFHYQRIGDHWIGLATPPQDGLKNVNWKLRFMAYGSDLPGTTGSLQPYPDKQTALQNMHDGGRAKVYVQFLGHWEELPKVVLIQLNGQTLCSASEYGSPSTSSTRELHMSVSSSSSSSSSGFKPVEFHRPPVIATTKRTITSSGNNFGANPFLTSLTSKKPIFSLTSKKPVVVDTQTRTDTVSYECGVEGLVGLQIGGETLPRGRFPWLAALYHDSNQDSNKIELVYKCVSTLISARTVITAAHCIYGRTPAQLRVYVGRHDTALHPEKDATLMAVESVRTHPDYVGNLVPDSDVGLLVLSERVQYTTYVRPICLWSSSSYLGIDDTEETAVAGWGIDGNFKPTRFPSTVSVRAVSREECLREMVTAKDFLTPRTLCAGNSQGHGPCLGDSGGGLMVLRNGRWFVRGIVSVAQRSGNGCDLSRFVIYCDVARHLSLVSNAYVYVSVCGRVDAFRLLFSVFTYLSRVFVGDMNIYSRRFINGGTMLYFQFA